MYDLIGLDKRALGTRCAPRIAHQLGLGSLPGRTSDSRQSLPRSRPCQASRRASECWPAPSLRPAVVESWPATSPRPTIEREARVAGDGTNGRSGRGIDLGSCMRSGRSADARSAGESSPRHRTPRAVSSHVTQHVASGILPVESVSSATIRSMPPAMAWESSRGYPACTVPPERGPRAAGPDTREPGPDSSLAGQGRRRVGRGVGWTARLARRSRSRPARPKGLVDSDHPVR